MARKTAVQRREDGRSLLFALPMLCFAVLLVALPLVVLAMAFTILWPRRNR